MATGRRVDFSVAVVAAGLAALAVAGCMPVPTVVGRPAAVVSGDRIKYSFGAGAVDHDVTVSEGMPDLWSTRDATWGYGHAAVTFGLGHRFDVQTGMNNGQGYADFRWQALGSPDGAAGFRRCPVDVSLECGASMWIAVAAIPFAPYLPFQDSHYGVNVSLPCGRATPYASYRRHRVSHTFYYEGCEDHWTGRGYPNIHFSQDMYYLGIEFRLTDRLLGAGPRMTVECFWGETTTPSTGYYALSARVRGVNVLVSMLEW